MLFRIIYRPSYPRLTVTRNSVDGAVASSEPETGGRSSEPATKHGPHAHRVVVRSVAMLMIRMGAGALIMAAWRIATDLGLPLSFVFKDGVLSHWQVWFGAGVLSIGGAGLVARRLQFGKPRENGDPAHAEEAA